MAHFRDKKTGSLLQQEISQIIMRDLKDPRITGFITVTDVVMSKDLKVATVFISILGEPKVCETTMAGLLSSVGFIKKQLSRVVTLKHMPEIRIKWDHSVEKGVALYHKIEEIEKEDQSRKIETN